MSNNAKVSVRYAKSFKRWPVVSAIVVFLGCFVGLQAYTNAQRIRTQDVKDAQATVTIINQKFDEINAVGASDSGSQLVNDDKKILGLYADCDTQFHNLGKSRVQHDSATHTSFDTLNKTWQARYSYLKEYFQYQIVLDSFNASIPPSGQTLISDKSSALKAYGPDVKNANTALASLKKLHPSQTHVAKLEADLKTYLTSYRDATQKAIDSVNQGHNLFDPNSNSSDDVALVLDINGGRDNALKQTGNVYLAASQKDIDAIDSDTAKLAVRPKLNDFSKQLGKINPAQ